MNGRHRERVRRWARQPVVHFAAIGAALLALHDLWRPAEDPSSPPGAVRPPIVVTAERVRRMEADFADRWGAPPTTAQLRALVGQAVEEEMLYREAQVLALGFGDASVRRRLLEKARAVSRRPSASAEELVEEARALGLDDDVVIRRLLATKMRLLLQQESAGGPIAEAAILEYRERNRELFLRPRTVTFSHVFLAHPPIPGGDGTPPSRAGSSGRKDGGRRAVGAGGGGGEPGVIHGTGARAGDEVHAALVALNSGSPPPVEDLSDPFPLGLRLAAQTERQLAARFGKPFADRVLALEPGRWDGPLASPYGLHLVRVEEHAPAGPAPLEAVRESIRLALTKERAARNLAGGLARLRALYEVRIEGGDDSVAAEPAPEDASS